MFSLNKIFGRENKTSESAKSWTKIEEAQKQNAEGLGCILVKAPKVAYNPDDKKISRDALGNMIYAEGVDDGEWVVDSFDKKEDKIKLKKLGTGTKLVNREVNLAKFLECNQDFN
ncbi:MAG: hypothetical protein WCF94_01060 [bacterium]